MERRFVIFIFLFSLGMLVQSSKVVQAQAPGKGLMNAISFKALPYKTAFSVRPMDDSYQNMVLKQKFEHLLKTEGFSISKNAPLVITFGTNNELSSYTTRNRRSILELDAHGGREGGENARMRKTIGHFRLDVSIVNRTDGKHYWKAWATTNQSRSGGGDLILAMVPEVVNRMGKKVTSQIFDLF